MNKYWYLLGIITLTAQAIPLDEALFNLGAAWQTEQNSVQAIHYFKEALAHNPNNLTALFQLGCELYKQGAIKEAIDCFEKRLALVPHCGQSHFYAGLAHAVLNNTQAAIDHYYASLALQPDNQKTYYCLALALEKTGAHAQAVEKYEQALNFDPNNTDTRLRLALALVHSKQYEEALKQYQELITRNPSNYEYILEEARLYTLTKKYDLAITCYEKLVTNFPENPSLLTLLGHLYTQNGRYSQAAALYEKVLEKQPDNYILHFDLAKNYCRQGLLNDAFMHLHLSNSTNKSLENNSLADLAGKTIWVQGEWSHEDTLLFIPYLRYLKNINAFIILQAPKCLIPLLASCPYIDKLISLEKPEPLFFDTKIPLLSLPYLCAQEDNYIPPFRPYLHVPPNRLLTWQKKIAPTKNMGIYLKETLSTETLSQLLTLANATRHDVYMLHPTQDYPPLKDLDYHTCIHTCGKGFDESAESLVDLSAVISLLDCLITTDGTAAHIAGALGKEVIILHDIPCSWRWMTTTSTTPWYPTMRIFCTQDNTSMQKITQLLMKHT